MGSSGGGIDQNKHGWKSEAVREIYAENPEKSLTEMLRIFEKKYPGNTMTLSNVSVVVNREKEKEEFGGITPKFEEAILPGSLPGSAPALKKPETSLPSKKSPARIEEEEEGEPTLMEKEQISGGKLLGLQLLREVHSWLLKSDIRPKEILGLLKLVGKDIDLLHEVLITLDDLEGREGK